MKIFTITAAYDDLGGAARVATDLTETLRQQAQSVTVYAGVHRSTAPYVHTIKKTWSQRLWSRLGANDMEYFSTDYLLNTPDFKEADIVHAHNLHGWYFDLRTLGKMAALKPVVWTLHDMWAITSHCAHTDLPLQANGFFTCPPRDTYPRLLWNNRRHLEAVKQAVYSTAPLQIVTPSQWLKELVDVSVLKSHPSHLIYNGVDTATYQPQDKHQARTELGLPHDQKIVLFVANGGISNIFKGGDFVRKLAHQYQQYASVQFVCIGGATHVHEENLTHVPGIHDQAQLARWYAAADVFLFTSRSENFPLVVLEAMACGLPVVSFRVGGVPEAVVHGTYGYIANYLDSDDLAAGVEKLLTQSPSDTLTMTRACREAVVDNFSLSRMTQQYRALYESLVPTPASKSDNVQSSM